MVVITSGGEYLHSLAHHHEDEHAGEHGEEHSEEQCPLGKFLVQSVVTIGTIVIAHGLFYSRALFLKSLDIYSYLELHLPEGRAPPTLA